MGIVLLCLFPYGYADIQILILYSFTSYKARPSLTGA